MERPKASAPPEQGKTFTGRVVIDDRAWDCVFTGATLVCWRAPPCSGMPLRRGALWTSKSSARNTIGLAGVRPESGFRALFDEICRCNDEAAPVAVRNPRSAEGRMVPTDSNPRPSVYKTVALPS